MRARSVLLGLLAATAMSAVQATAAQHSIVGDFSDTANPNGVWSYGTS